MDTQLKIGIVLFTTLTLLIGFAIIDQGQRHNVRIEFCEGVGGKFIGFQDASIICKFEDNEEIYVKEYYEDFEFNKKSEFFEVSQSKEGDNR